MMRRLVDEQAARMGHEGVPAAEVVGAVLDIEIPVEVHRNHVADRAGQQHLLDRSGCRREAVVEAHIDASARAALGFENSPAHLRRCGHRLFREHVDPCFKRVDDHLGMGVVARANDQHIGTRFGQHDARVVEGRCIGANRRVGMRKPYGIPVGEPDQFNPIAAIGEQFLAPGAGTAMAGTNQGDPALSFRHQAFSSVKPGQSLTRSDSLSSNGSVRACSVTICAGQLVVMIAATSPCGHNEGAQFPVRLGLDTTRFRNRLEFCRCSSMLPLRKAGGEGMVRTSFSTCLKWGFLAAIPGCVQPAFDR